MMAEEKITRTRKKPKFLRQTWHKKIKLGKTVKKKRKWRAAKGIHSKIRLGEAGRARKPKIGWGSKKTEREKIWVIENLKQFENLKNVNEILIGKIGKKKRTEIIKKANEMKIKILNKYKKKSKKENLEEKDATS
jgi:large subunit ribosomal protein L32e